MILNAFLNKRLDLFSLMEFSGALQRENYTPELLINRIVVTITNSNCNSIFQSSGYLIVIHQLSHL